MKTLFATVAFLVITLFGTTLSAQSYQSAIGLRLGIPVAVSYKFFLNETAAMEIYGSYRHRKNSTYYYDYSWTTYGIGATYQVHGDLSSVAEGLQWFYGGGAAASFFTWADDAYYSDENNFGVSVHGALGLDYRFADAPVNISADWKPTFALTGYNNGFEAGYGALSVRYILGE